MILLSVTITLLLLRNRQIPLHQSSNFVLSLSNYSRSRTMLFDITAYAILWYSANTVDISSDVSDVAGSVLLFNVFSSVILNDPSISSSASIVSGLCCAVLSICDLYHNCSCLISSLFCLWSSTTILSCIFLTVSFI